MGRRHRHQIRHRHRHLRAAVAVLGATLVVAACSGSDDDSAGEPASVEPAEEQTAEDVAGGRAAADGDAADEADAAEGTGTVQPATAVDAGRSDGEGGFDLGAVGRDVIIEMSVVLGSDDVQRTVASVTAAASTLGGGIASSDVNYADGQDGAFAVLVVKVPPEAVDRFLGGLDDTATVRSLNQSARDVTEQLVDLDVRISNARQSVATVREFMGRTENLNELVTLEAELTRRQTELEQLEAQERNLSERVALSTITIEVQPNAVLPEPVTDDADDGLGDALRSGWEAFVTVLFGLAFVVAATLPFVLTLLVLGGIVWIVVRRRDRRSRSHHPARPQTEEPEDDREPELVG